MNQNIAMITDDEIRIHYKFFENCAKDYRRLATELINELAKQNRVNLEDGYPWLAINKSGKEKGIMKCWKYFRHGYHCCFEHINTGQTIEVPLVFGLEFGVLDPYFFVDFIKTSPGYHPLPVQLSNTIKCGEKIIKQMLILDKFEYISSNIEGHSGVVVKDREKVCIEVYKPIPEERRKFSFKRLFRK